MAAEAEADEEADAVAPQLVGPPELRILKSNLERRQKYKKSQSASFGKPPTRRTASSQSGQGRGRGVARGGVGDGGGALSKWGAATYDGFKQQPKAAAKASHKLQNALIIHLGASRIGRSIDRSFSLVRLAAANMGNVVSRKRGRAGRKRWARQESHTNHSYDYCHD